jgi:MFS family permease
LLEARIDPISDGKFSATCSEFWDGNHRMGATEASKPGEEANSSRVSALKVVFALGYVLQGLANPFQGLTYQSFFRHLRFDYGLSEAATQRLFSKSYLAWSLKPVIGFLIDAYGKTRTLLVGLLGLASLGYLLTPIVDAGPMVFFGVMFALSVAMAGTDVTIDRATLTAGAEEAAATGRSKASTVGLNQAICWTSIYGTAVFAGIFGGYVAEHVPFRGFLVGLAFAPLVVLGFVLRLPQDRAARLPLRRSIEQFWRGLNFGPVLGVMLFHFTFHFQPSIGPLWVNYLMSTLHLTQTQIGIGDGAGYAGNFLGVLLFVWKGVRWQETLGLRRLFRIYIVVAAVAMLAQYVLLDPWFGRITGGLSRLLPFLDGATVRVMFLCLYNLFQGVAIGLTNMSTFSLVGAVIPVAAAGSLFAGFMSVTNLAYSSSYGSGAWLYEHGMSLAPLRAIQTALFGIGGGPNAKLSLNVLIVLGSLAYAASFLVVRFLPDRRATAATATDELTDSSDPWSAIPAGQRRAFNVGALLFGFTLLGTVIFGWGLDPVSGTLMSFLGTTMLRKVALDALAKRLADRPIDGGTR